MTPKAEAVFEIPSHSLLCCTHIYPAGRDVCTDHVGGPPAGWGRLSQALGSGGGGGGVAGRHRRAGIFPIPPSPNYGFVILLPLEQEWGAPSHPVLWPVCYTVEGDKGESPWGRKGPCVLGTLARPQGILTPTLSATPLDGSSRAEAAPSEVDPQHVLAGKRPPAGGARHGQGALLLAQARPAQEVAAGKLVRRLLFEVGRKHSFAGGALGAQDAPRLLW